MTEEDLKISELGAYTNNSMNKEGIKKLINAVGDIASDIADKQDKLTAGNNISISEQNVISATDTIYTAGDNITIENNVISAIVGGSDWTYRTPNKDWTDLFTIGDYDVTASKDILFILDVTIGGNSHTATAIKYIPKGTKFERPLILSQEVLINNGILSFMTVNIPTTKIDSTSSSIDISYYDITITNGALAFDYYRTENYAKANIGIYTR